MLKLVLFLILLCFFRILPAVKADCNWDSVSAGGYYWRDYSGVIPKDAYPAGNNSNGMTTYVGQVLHDDQLIPARIDPDQKKVFYEWGYKEFEATNNIKILCTLFPEQFEWIKTGNRLINNITHKTFVIGGYEAGFITLLVGRKQLDNELVVGKVVFSKKQSTLNTTKGGKGYQHGTFEVLCYNKDYDIDIRFGVE